MSKPSPLAAAGRPGARGPAGQRGGALVWLLLLLLLVLAAGLGFYWYKFSSQNEALERREAQLTELEQSFNLLQQDLEEARSRTMDAERHIEDLERRLADMRGDQASRASLKAELEDLRNRGKDLQARLDLCQEKAQSLDGKHQDLSKAQDELQAAMASLEAENRELMERNEALQAALNEKESDNDQLESRNQTLRTDLQELEPRQRELKARVAELKALAKDSDELQKRLDACSSELETLKDRTDSRIGDLDAKRDDLAGDLDSLARKLAVCQGALAELKASDSADQTVDQARDSAEASMESRTPEQPQDQTTQDNDLKAQQEAARQAADQARKQRDDCASLAQELERLRAQGEAPDSGRLEELQDTLLQCRARAEELEAKHVRERQMAEAYESMIRDLKKEIQQKDVVLQRVKDRLEIKILGRILFALGSTHITPSGRSVLERILPSLEKVDDRQIYVVGHTDDVGINPDFKRLFPSNWELSAARAARVVRFITDRAPLDPALLAAVGVSYHHPEASNETPEGRARNRRVEIIIGAPLLLQ